MTQLIDTHQHLLYHDQLRYAWAEALPPLSGDDFSVADYQQLTEGRDVAGTIFMEVDADDYRKEARLISNLAADPDNQILGLIASCRPETDAGFDDWMDECAGLPVVGFRRILHEVADDMSQDQTFRANVGKIGKHGHVFDMVFRADQLPIARDFAAACDEMNLVLDHCGVPDIAGGEIDHWRKGISALAALPHVNCKISGILAYCSAENAGLETIEPYVGHIIESFGTDRLVWGSDWPVVNLTSNLPDWIDIFRQLITNFSPDEATAISSGNAQRIYGVAKA